MEKSSVRPFYETEERRNQRTHIQQEDAYPDEDPKTPEGTPQEEDSEEDYYRDILRNLKYCNFVFM